MHDGVAESIDAGDLVAIADGEAAAEIDHADVDASVLEVGEQHADLADRRFVGGSRGLLAADMEGEAVRVKAHVGCAKHQVPREFDGGAEFARQRPVRALVADQDAAIDARTRGIGGQFFKLLGRIEGEHRDAGLMGGTNRRDLFDGVAVADRGGGGAGGHAGGNFLEAGRIETGLELHKTLQNRAGRIGLHCIVDARQRQRIANGAEVFFHTIHIQNQTRRCRTVISQVTGDLGCHRTCTPL